MKCKLTLPEKLKDLRVEHGLSFEQLAEATGYPSPPSLLMKLTEAGR